MIFSGLQSSLQTLMLSYSVIIIVSFSTSLRSKIWKIRCIYILFNSESLQLDIKIFFLIRNRLSFLQLSLLFSCVVSISLYSRQTISPSLRFSLLILFQLQYLNIYLWMNFNYLLISLWSVYNYFTVRIVFSVSGSSCSILLISGLNLQLVQNGDIYINFQYAKLQANQAYSSIST